MPIRSNDAIAEELKRLSDHIFGKPPPSCPHADCDNYGSPVTEAGLYARFGKTPSGTPRWRCNACRKTITEAGAPQKRQRKAHKNRDVFSLLMNKSPLRRIAEVTGLDPKTIYGKIALIHRQSQAFAGHRELQLVQGMVLPKMYVAIDHQSHIVNWSSRKDRRNVVLSAIASADLESGYVFGFYLNFDPSIDPDQVERDAAAIGDLGRPEADRRFARVWLSQDYEAAVTAAATRKKNSSKTAAGETRDDPLEQNIAEVYAVAQARPDVEVCEKNTQNTALPGHGVQLKAQYTMHGHFHLLAALMNNAEKVRVYMDQDSGIRAAFMSAFADRIKDRTADGWYVSVQKGSTVVEKERAVQKSKARLREAAELNPTLKEDELPLLLMKEEMTLAKPLGQYEDQWLAHPVPNMSEPAKKVCWLTDMGDYDEDHAARLYLKASLHAVDRFFMQARRRLSLAERSIVTASTDRRVWQGYSAYRPENLAMVLGIFRVFYNYCKPGDDKQTPAMRLGLAKAPIPLEDVLYFQPSA